MAKRLENHIPSVIHPDQSSFVKNRFIGESIRFTEDIMELFDLVERQGIILQLDFEKAFDSVKWQFMLNVLKKK